MSLTFRDRIGQSSRVGLADICIVLMANQPRSDFTIEDDSRDGDWMSSKDFVPPLVVDSGLHTQLPSPRYL